VVVKERSIAYLLVGKDGVLMEAGGALSIYGLESVCEGERLGEAVFFLDGLLPIGDEPVFLPRLKMESGLCADIHLFPGEQGDWVLFLDASMEEARESLLQQNMNELSLLRRRLSKIYGHQKDCKEEV
jgi:hypothetical protein